MNFTLEILCLIMLALLPLTCAMAQPDSEAAAQSAAPENRENVFPLPTVAVTAKRIEAPPTLIVRQVTAADIAARNAHTVGDALIHVPGVNAQIGGTSGESNVWIRGYRDRDVLVLFDGIPIASGFEGSVDLNEFALQRVASIQVMKGAPSVIYGTNGVGGVIDVVPQTGLTAPYFEGAVELGTDHRRLLRASGGGGNGNLGFALSAQHQEAGDYSLSDDFMPALNQPAGNRVNSAFERNSVLLQLDAQESPAGRTDFFVNISDADKGLPVEAGVIDPDYQRLTKSRRKTLGLSNHFKAIPLSLKLYYNAYDTELTTYHDAAFTTVDEVEAAKDYSWGGKLYSTLETSPNNTLVLTAGGQADVFKGEGALEEGNKAELATYTLAAEDEFWVTRTLSLAAGGIFTYFDQTRLHRSSSEFNPQIALAWQAASGLSVHASAAQRTRFPKLRELYRQRYGNPDLKPQTANNYEVGVSFRHLHGITSDLTLFHSDVDDLIERLDRKSLYENLRRVTMQGVETASGGWVNDRLYVRAAYTFLDAVEDLTAAGSRQLRSRPRHTAMAELRYRFRHDIEVSLSGIYVSGLYDLGVNDLYTRIASYFVANMKAQWAVANHCEAYLAVTNLGDENYVQRLPDPREGRALMLGFNFNY